MLNKLRSKFPQEGYDPAHVHASMFETTSLSEAGYAVLSRCLIADPKKRVSTGKEALDMQYFQAGTAPALQRVDQAQLKEAKEASTPSPPKPPVRSRSRAVTPNEDVADRRATHSRTNENAIGAGVSLPAIDVSRGDAKSLSRADSPSAKAASPSAKSPRSPFAKGLTGLGVAAAGFVFGKLSPQ